MVVNCYLPVLSRVSSLLAPPSCGSAVGPDAARVESSRRSITLSCTFVSFSLNICSNNEAIQHKVCERDTFRVIFMHDSVKNDAIESVYLFIYPSVCLYAT